MSTVVQKARSLGRDQILNTPNAGRVAVPVPEWGGFVWAHVMSGSERDAWESEIIKQGAADANINMRAKLLVLTVRDDEGRPLFTDADVERLGQKDHRILDHVIEQSKRINRLTDKTMEELAGNSVPSRSEGQ